MSKKDKIETTLEICDEPEIQWLILNPDLTKEIETWVLDRGGKPKKNKRGEVVGPKIDSSVYLDTKDFYLLDHGAEYRVKEKGKKCRHDLKTPHNVEDRDVVRDENDIFWRREFKFEEKGKRKPSLKPYFGETLLAPFFEESGHRFFNMDLMNIFRAQFLKKKFDMEVYPDDDSEASKVEYSLQDGHLESMSGSRRTPHLKIVELEDRSGDLDVLLQERAEFKAEFENRGLILLPKRKLFMGFELMVPDMTREQNAMFEAVMERQGANQATVKARRSLMSELIA